MKSGLCHDGLHTECSVQLFNPNGKRFRCSCACHPVANQKSSPLTSDDWEEEEDDE